MANLFVDPVYLGKGFGKKLWLHSLGFAKSKEWAFFHLCADPFAADKFYYPMGCIKVDEVTSSVQTNRKLPVLEYRLNT
jgi:predicted N-acetyltransferase YhbS